MIYVLAACIAIGLFWGGLYVYWAAFRYRFSVISKGQVYQSAQMPAKVLLKFVRRYGIRTVIDMRRNGSRVAEERRTLAKGGVAYFHFPSRQVPSEETIERCLDIMDRPENRPVLVHCRHGKGRSRLLAALFRIEHEGWSNKRAWRATRIMPYLGSFAAHRRKGKFMLNYVARRDDSAVFPPVEISLVSESFGETR